MKKISIKSVLRELFEQGAGSELGTTEGTEGLVAEMQRMVDGNQFLKGKTVSPDDLVEAGDYVLYASDDAASHILERHTNEMKPGSTFEPSLKLKDIMREVLANPPSEETSTMVKWLGFDTGSTVGGMGVASASPEEVSQMEDYTMPDGRREVVKLRRGGERAPTSEVSLITAKLGELSNGKTALSLVTMFPGGTTVDGVTIPPNRSDFAKAGLYFIIPGEGETATSTEAPAKLSEVINPKRWQKLSRIIKG